ncbi:MAG: hypothetical protein IT558_03845 [Alphaproteobacteria bacterium]|nr:hypothetical protein [Alphaproteobacteria bacterium]
MKIRLTSVFNYKARQGLNLLNDWWDEMPFNLKKEEDASTFFRQRVLGNLKIANDVLKGIREGDKDAEKQSIKEILRIVAKRYPSYEHNWDLLSRAVGSYLSAASPEETAALVLDTAKMAKVSPARRSLLSIWPQVLDFISRAPQNPGDGYPAEDDPVKALKIAGETLKSQKYDGRIAFVALQTFLKLMRPAYERGSFEQVEELSQDVLQNAQSIRSIIPGTRSYAVSYIRAHLNELRQDALHGMDDIRHNISEGPFIE